MNGEQVEKLIAAVKNHEELYNTDHQKYKLIKHKEEIWAQIALDCGFDSANSTKQQWKKLRDSYREALKRQKPKSDQSPGVLPTRSWKYKNQMEFLKKYMASREPYTADRESAFLDDSSTDSKCNLDFLINNPKKNSRLRKSSEILNMMQNKRYKERMKKNKKFSDAGLHEFFVSMRKITSTLPKLQQIEIKRKIFDIITSYENRAALDNSVDVFHHGNFDFCMTNSVPPTSPDVEVKIETEDTDTENFDFSFVAK